MATKTDDAANSAGQAAYDRALLSSWPPTKEDVEAIGAAAGAAAGAIFGGGVGAIVGGAVGGFIGGAAYEIINAIPNAGDNPAARYLSAVYEFTNKAVKPTISRLSAACNTSDADTREALKLWGWSFDAISNRELARDPNHGFAVLEQNKREFFAAVAARTAECETVKAGAGKSKNSAGALIVLGVVSAVGLGIIQKLVTRGKF